MLTLFLCTGKDVKMKKKKMHLPQYVSGVFFSLYIFSVFDGTIEKNKKKIKWSAGMGKLFSGSVLCQVLALLSLPLSLLLLLLFFLLFYLKYFVLSQPGRQSDIVWIKYRFIALGRTCVYLLTYIFGSRWIRRNKIFIRQRRRRKNEERKRKKQYTHCTIITQCRVKDEYVRYRRTWRCNACTGQVWMAPFSGLVWIRLMPGHKLEPMKRIQFGYFIVIFFSFSSFFFYFIAIEAKELPQTDYIQTVSLFSLPIIFFLLLFVVVSLFFFLYIVEAAGCSF